MDWDDLSTPLLQSGKRRTLKRNTRTAKYKRKSMAIKRSVRRSDVFNPDVFSTRTSSVASVDTGYSETTERISNVDESAKELKMVEEEELPVSLLTKTKTACVLLVTIVAVASYCVSFPEIIVGGVSSVNLTVLGVAAGVCALVTPVVWLNEWRLIRYPGENV
jgi:hypothetical protein